MVAAALMLISRGSLLVLLVLVVFFDTRLSNQLRLLRTFVGFCLVPGIGAWLLERVFAAKVLIENGTLVLLRRRQRVEVPCESIGGVMPWTVPLPAGGVWLRLKSGRRLEYGLRVADPIALGEELADAGAAAAVRELSANRLAIYTRSRNSTAPRWYHLALKFGLFALVPTLPLFRLHQWIAYGGTFGEYYTYGLQAYLLAFAIHWSTFTIYLVLYAAGLRAVVEVAALAGAWLVPARAAGVRRVAELIGRILYYGGVPLFLIRFFIST